MLVRLLSVIAVVMLSASVFLLSKINSNIVDMKDVISTKLESINQKPVHKQGEKEQENEDIKVYFPEQTNKNPVSDNTANDPSINSSSVSRENNYSYDSFIESHNSSQMNVTTSRKIFLSYAKADYEMAKKVAELAQVGSQDLSVFLDTSKDEIGDEGKKALIDSDAFAILLTSNYSNSAIATQEYEMAIENNLPILVLASPETPRSTNIFGGNFIQITPENRSLFQVAILKAIDGESPFARRQEAESSTQNIPSNTSGNIKQSQPPSSAMEQIKQNSNNTKQVPQIPSTTAAPTKQNAAPAPQSIQKGNQGMQNSPSQKNNLSDDDISRMLDAGSAKNNKSKQ